MSARGLCAHLVPVSGWPAVCFRSLRRVLLAVGCGARVQRPEKRSSAPELRPITAAAPGSAPLGAGADPSARGRPMRLFNSRAPLAVVAVLSLVAGAAGVVAAQQGTITGQVTDQSSRQPLVGARVTVVGTSLVTASRAEGRYVIPNVPPGQVTVRATFIGYAAGSQSVTVAPDEAVTADVALVLTPYSLDEVVVTATGEQTKREVGNVINTIRADSLVATRPIANMNDLLSAKAPGVEVLAGTLPGAAPGGRSRGPTSLRSNTRRPSLSAGAR